MQTSSSVKTCAACKDVYNRDTGTLCLAVIFVDADAIVVSNMDEVFKCPGFCATLRHSERFNSGVMAITPSTETFNDMISSIGELQSYTGYVNSQARHTESAAQASIHMLLAVSH